MEKNAIAYIVVYFLIVNIIVCFVVKNLLFCFDDAKVGGFLYACKFFFEFLIGMWRLARDNATEGTRGGWNCRVRGRTRRVRWHRTIRDEGDGEQRGRGILKRIIAKGHELFA